MIKQGGGKKPKSMLDMLTENTYVDTAENIYLDAAGNTYVDTAGYLARVEKKKKAGCCSNYLTIALIIVIDTN